MVWLEKLGDGAEVVGVSGGYSDSNSAVEVGVTQTLHSAGSVGGGGSPEQQLLLPWTRSGSVSNLDFHFQKSGSASYSDLHYGVQV